MPYRLLAGMKNRANVQMSAEQTWGSVGKFRFDTRSPHGTAKASFQLNKHKLKLNKNQHENTKKNMETVTTYLYRIGRTHKFF